MDPIDWIPYQVMRRYPHMAPADTIIWERYIRLNPRAFDAVSYDVPVGEGAEFDTTVNPDTGGDVGRLYKLRIDVLAKVGADVYLIEVKPRADARAIWQVKTYLRLAQRDLPELKALRPLIITDALRPDMKSLGEAEGVEVRVV